MPCRYRTDQQRCLWQLTMAILIWSDCYSTKGPISTLSMMCVKSINTSHPIISYRIISYHMISNHTISYHVRSYHITSYHMISYHIPSYHITSYHIIFYYRRLFVCTVCLWYCLSNLNEFVCACICRCISLLKSARPLVYIGVCLLMLICCTLVCLSFCLLVNVAACLSVCTDSALIIVIEYFVIATILSLPLSLFFVSK